MGRGRDSWSRVHGMGERSWQGFMVMEGVCRREVKRHTRCKALMEGVHGHDGLSWSWEAFMEGFHGYGRGSWSWKRFMVMEGGRDHERGSWSWKGFMVMEGVHGHGRGSWS